MTTLFATRYRLPWTHYQNVPADDAHFASIEAIKFVDGAPVKWAIREGGSRLAHDGLWEFEPNASSRDEDFYERTHFNSAEEAEAFATDKMSDRCEKAEPKAKPVQ